MQRTDKTRQPIVDEELLTPSTRPTVLLVTINREGRPRPIRVQHSSGSMDLDDIAQDWASRMRFSPCLKDGAAVPAEFTFTIEWQRPKRP